MDFILGSTDFYRRNSAFEYGTLSILLFSVKIALRETGIRAFSSKAHMTGFNLYSSKL